MVHTRTDHGSKVSNLYVPYGMAEHSNTTEHAKMTIAPH